MEVKYAIELKGISKTFGTVIANDSIDLNVKKGEILALLGENGSGKTTLMNMLSGIYKPDEGQIFIEGQKVIINSPEDAKRLHIGMVHQHFKLIEKFSAADNICISDDNDKSIFLTNKRYKKIKDFSNRYGFSIDPKKLICDMAVSEKQTVEILKVLYNGADILILDEPTAVLTLQETRKLFSILRKMRDSGCAIIIITHKLNEVLEISDRVTILRKGKSVATVNTAETNAKELTDLMVGKSVDLQIERPECNTTKTLLKLENVTIANPDGSLAIDDVSFDVKGGEILGVAGVSGCGQKELCEAIAGLQTIKNGSIIFKDEHIESKTPKQIIDCGISMSFIPEDRLGMGLAASLDITDNMMLKNYRDNKGPFVDRKSAETVAKKVVNDLGVVTPGIHTPIRRLSGGNVQKVLLGREMQASPQVIITAYPVRGLDINSSYTIYNILNDEKKKGTGILFVGEDLDVMLELCDRIMVLCHGKVTGIVDAKSTSKEELGLLMTDAHNNDIYKEADDNTFSVNDIVEKDDTLTENNKTKKHKKAHKPLLHLVRRPDLTVGKSILLYTLSVLVALILGGIFILLNNKNPFDYYATVLTGCFKNAIYIKGFIRIIIPLIVTSLGISVAFKMKFWNVGGNGQFVIGAIFASAAVILLGDSTPKWLTLLCMAVAGAIGGGLFGLIPAVFKVKFGASETLLTLMMNYIAFYILKFLKKTYFFGKVGPNGRLTNRDFETLTENGHLPKIAIGNITFDISLIIALIFVILVFIYLRYSKQGYEITVVGDSQNTARYAGMNVSKIIIRTMIVSSMIIGVAGMLQVAGEATNYTLSDNISSDVGWTGIIVAWLAKLNPYSILIVSLLMGILNNGTAVAESVFNISSASSDILQGIILFSVLAADFFTRYHIKFAHKSKEGVE